MVVTVVTEVTVVTVVTVVTEVTEVTQKLFKKKTYFTKKKFHQTMSPKTFFNQNFTKQCHLKLFFNQKHSISFISELTSRVPQGVYGDYIYRVSPF